MPFVTLCLSYAVYRLVSELLHFLFCTASQVQFKSRYREKTFTGLVGSSVNFTWSFSGDVKIVQWGLALTATNDIDNHQKLVSLARAGLIPLVVPAAYTGRVAGSRNGNSSSGQAIFTLSNIRKEDERFYGCRLSPASPYDSSPFDSVHLSVEGE